MSIAAIAVIGAEDVTIAAIGTEVIEATVVVTAVTEAIDTIAAGAQCNEYSCRDSNRRSGTTISPAPTKQKTAP